MEYVYAALLLHEADEELNEDNITAVLEAVGIEVEESRVKALVAALEDVDIEDALAQAAAVPSGGGAPVSGESEAEPAEAEEAPETDEAEEAEAEPEPEEEEDVSGEGLGDLFG